MCDFENYFSSISSMLQSKFIFELCTEMMQQALKMKNTWIVLILLTVSVAQLIWRFWVVNYRVIASDNIEITNNHTRHHKTFNKC